MLILIVYRKGDEIRHPVTGKSFGWATETLGEGNIGEIHVDFSKARLSDDPGVRKPLSGT
jgi:hypothetical protein